MPVEMDRSRVGPNRKRPDKLGGENEAVGEAIAFLGKRGFELEQLKNMGELDIIVMAAQIQSHPDIAAVMEETSGKLPVGMTEAFLERINSTSVSVKNY